MLEVSQKLQIIFRTVFETTISNIKFLLRKIQTGMNLTRMYNFAHVYIMSINEISLRNDSVRLIEVIFDQMQKNCNMCKFQEKNF